MKLGLVSCAFVLVFNAEAGANNPPPAACPVTSLPAAYQEYYDKPPELKKPEFIYQEIELNGKAPSEIFFASRASCGARGCEYALFEKFDQNCYRSLGEFSGQIEPLQTRSHGYLNLRLSQGQGHLSEKMVVNLVYDPKKARYQELKETRRRSFH